MKLEVAKKTAEEMIGTSFHHIEPVLGGRNSRIFRLKNSAGSFALKFFRSDAYNARDRFDAETSALNIFAENGMKCVPKLVAQDLENNCILMEWIDGETIKDVSVKKPISDNPYNDNAIVAVFYFRQASDLFSAITLMMGQKVEGEFYMDNIPLLFKEMGKCSVIFNVDLYVEFGTPAGLYKYNLIEYHCRYGSYDDVLWKKYFNSI